MTTKVANWGNSLGLRLPKAFTEMIDLKAGSCVRLELKGKSILITPVEETLAEMVARITPENRHEEYWTDKPQGKEVW